MVTGGAGYIGSFVAKKLFCKGFMPFVFDNLSLGHKEFVKWGPLFEADLNCKFSIIQAIKEANPIAIIHLAGASDVAESIENPLKYYQNNTQNTLNLLEAIQETKIIPFIFSSTCAVYGEPAYLPLDENHVKKPITAYGKSKLCIEFMLEDFHQKYEMPLSILRYFNAAGASFEQEIGERHRKETHLIPNLLKTALGQNSSFSLFGTDFDTQDGSSVRDYIHVEDLATAHVLALEKLLQTPSKYVLNLGSGNGYSVNEIISKVQTLFNLDIKVEKKPKRIGDAPILYADTNKAQEVLGFIPKHSSLETILQTAMNWHKKDI